MRSEEPILAREWVTAAVWIAVVVGLVGLAIAFVVTNGFACGCTRPA